MFKENSFRNSMILSLWENGYTIDEISSTTGIPRSTVGYYVRKFNKRARKGEPIDYSFQKVSRNEKELACLAASKILSFQLIMKMLNDDGPDKVLKILQIAKLFKDLKNDFFVTEKEQELINKNIFYIFEQMVQGMSKTS